MLFLLKSFTGYSSRPLRAGRENYLLCPMKKSAVIHEKNSRQIIVIYIRGILCLLILLFQVIGFSALVSVLGYCSLDQIASQRSREVRRKVEEQVMRVRGSRRPNDPMVHQQLVPRDMAKVRRLRKIFSRNKKRYVDSSQIDSAVGMPGVQKARALLDKGCDTVLSPVPYFGVARPNPAMFCACFRVFTCSSCQVRSAVSKEYVSCDKPK